MKKLLLTVPMFVFLSSCAQNLITPIGNQSWRNGEPYRPIGAPSLKPYILKEDPFTKGLQEMSTRIKQSQ